MAEGAFSRSLQDQIEAQRRFRLSHAHVQMARELRRNWKNLGGASEGA